MKKGTTSPARQAVKDMAMQLGEFTREQLLTAMEPFMDRPFAAQAADSMFRRDPEIKLARRDSRRLENGQRVWMRVYAYKSTDARDEWSKSFAEVGASRAIMQRSQTAAKTASGLPAQYFTAPFRAASEKLPHGFPPHYPWDEKPRFFKTLAPIAQLQATLRRPIGMEAA